MNWRWMLVGAALLLAPAAAWGQYAFPPPPPPEEYGNLLIRRGSADLDIQPVSFSHWVHRQKHTCRVCHFELQFNMEVNTTEITEAANRAGMFCGACHDGKELFGHTEEEDCEKCHNGDLRRGSERLWLLWRLPESRYGNQIDWVAALENGWIKPVPQLWDNPSQGMGFENVLELESKWANAPSAIFPHDKHIAWLDCNDCHPYIFNIKKKFTKGFRMTKNIKGEFCGVCHNNVAFPLTDCVRCHTSMQNPTEYPEPESR
jgi:c(7)-type cytochrome triheme protein